MHSAALPVLFIFRANFSVFTPHVAPIKVKFGWGLTNFTFLGSGLLWVYGLKP